MAKKPKAISRVESDHTHDGQEALDEALSLLGPFQFETTEAALRGGLTAHPAYGFPCKERALAAISKLAAGFVRASQEEGRSPRVKDIVGQVEAVRRAADGLVVALRDMDDISVLVLRSAASPYLVEGSPPPAHLKRWFEAAVIEQGPVWWIERLEALAQYCRGCTKAFVDEWGSGQTSAPDKGGDTKPYLRLEGRAEWQLVGGAWPLFDFYRPGKASGYVGGLFYEFVTAIFQFATGDPEVKGFDTRIKRYVVLRRKRDELAAKLSALFAERERSRPNPGGRLDREIVDLMALGQDLDDEFLTGLPPRRPKVRNLNG